MTRRTARLSDPDLLASRYGPWGVVTGASSGIGRALADRAAAAGLHLVLVARGAEALQTLADDLERRHQVRTRVVAADLARPEGVAAVLEQSADLDVGLLVAAAGYGAAGLFLDRSIDDELAMLDVNCRAVTELSFHVGRRLAARGRGGIVLFGSLVGRQGAPWQAHYAATKAHVQTLGEGLHTELRPRGVDVLVVLPGPVRSGFADRAGLTMGMADTADDVADPILRALARRRRTVVPGRVGRLLTGSLGALDRGTRIRVMGRIMRGMAQSPPQREGSAADVAA